MENGDQTLWPGWLGLNPGSRWVFLGELHLVSSGDNNSTNLVASIKD